MKTTYASDTDFDRENDLGMTESVDLNPYKETDGIIGQYFGEVRQHRLLAPEEERALWRQITIAKKRERRALCMAPTALLALAKLALKAEAAEPQDDLRRHVANAVAELQGLATRLQGLRSRRGAIGQSALARRNVRHAYAELLRQWCKACEVLAPYPQVCDAMRKALTAAHTDGLQDIALHTAYSVWLCADGRLRRLKERMVNANLRLVIHVAARFRERGLSLQDLIQEGNIGLMRAVDRFDPEREVKTVTYAHWWIRQALNRAIADQSRIIRLPSHMYELYQQARRAAMRLWSELRRPPTNQEIAGVLGRSVEEIENLQAVFRPIIHYEQVVPEAVGPGEDRNLVERLEDESIPESSAIMADKQLRQRIAACLECLTSREAKIVRMRYGLGDQGGSHTLQEIATELNLSRERVRQLEKGALEKIRHSADWATLQDFV